VSGKIPSDSPGEKAGATQKNLFYISIKPSLWVALIDRGAIGYTWAPGHRLTYYPIMSICL